MRYPKRPSQHITETISWKILADKLPDEWILRDVVKNDYGIDAYVEIISPTGEVKGDLCFLQLKGTKSIPWKAQPGGALVASLGKIKHETVSYWMGLPVPVFLVWTDTKERKAFFVPVKSAVRVDYGSYLQQKTFSVQFSQDKELVIPAGIAAFQEAYSLEKDYRSFRYRLRDLLINRLAYLDYIQKNQNRDVFLPVDDSELLLLIHLYELCQYFRQYVPILWQVPALSEVFKQDKAQYGEAGVMLHEQHHDRMLKSLEVGLANLQGAIMVLVSQKQRDYWRVIDPLVLKKCDTLRYEGRKGAWPNQIN